jgi:argininosuccinate lyase
VPGQWPLALHLAAEVVATAKLHPEAMRRAASDGWLCATDLAEYLAGRGVAFHEAHEIVGRLVLESTRTGRQPHDVTLKDLQRYSPRFDAKALKLLTPEAGVARRDVPGGTAPRAVKQALREARGWLRTLGPTFY